MLFVLQQRLSLTVFNVRVIIQSSPDELFAEDLYSVSRALQRRVHSTSTGGSEIARAAVRSRTAITMAKIH